MISLASFVDMIQAMPNVMADDAFSNAASATRAAFANIATQAEAEAFGERFWAA